MLFLIFLQGIFVFFTISFIFVFCSSFAICYIKNIYFFIIFFFYFSKRKYNLFFHYSFYFVMFLHQNKNYNLFLFHRQLPQYSCFGIIYHFYIVKHMCFPKQNNILIVCINLFIYPLPVCCFYKVYASTFAKIFFKEWI